MANVGQGHRCENWTYHVRWQMFECVLLIFFVIILAIWQHTKTNEFHIFLTFEIENVGQGLSQ